MVSKNSKGDSRKSISYSEKSVVRDAFRNTVYGMDYNPTKIDNKTWSRMMQDAQVRAALSVVTLSCLAKGNEFQYPGENKDLGNEMIKYLTIAFERVNQNTNNVGGMHPVYQELINNSLGTGYSVSEIVYQKPEDDDYIYMKKWKVLPKTTLKNCFNISDYGDLEKVIQNQSSSDGKIVFQGKDLDRLIIWSHNKDGGNWYGRSELLSVYKNWWAKQYYLQFWGIALERYATPWLVAYVEDPDELDAFTAALDKSRPTTNFSTCLGNKIDLMESSGNGMLVYERAIKYQDEQIMRGMLVPTLVMGIEETGARSLGDTHFDLFSWRVQDIQKELADAVQVQINRLIDMNFDNVDAYPKLVFQPLITKDRKMLGDMLDKLIMQGVISPKEKWIRPFLGLPPPDREVFDEMQEEEEEEKPEEETEAKHSHISLQDDDGLIQEDFLLIERMLDDGESEIKKIFNRHTKEILSDYETALESRKFVVDDDYDIVDGILIDRNSTEEDLSNVLFVSYMASNDYLQDAFLELGLGASGEVDEELLRRYTDAWAKGMYNSYYGPMRAEMNNRILMGMARGDSNNEIFGAIQRISGDYTRQQAETHSRTVMSTVINVSRMDYYKKNKDFVVGMRYSAILDDRTTDFCASHHGMYIDINDPLVDFINPPNHFQCTECGDTLIKTINGDVPISDIDIGDKVMTHTGKYKPVTYVHHKQSPKMYNGDIVELVLDNGKYIRFTPGHPIMTGIGWMNIEEINVGDIVTIIVFDSGAGNDVFKYSEVVERNVEHLETSRLLYNLSVKDDESYIANSVVVHNCRSILQPVTVLDEGFKPDWEWEGLYPQKGFGQEEILEFLEPQ